jgi:hypothetical protein
LANRIALAKHAPELLGRNDEHVGLPNVFGLQLDIGGRV